MREEGMLDNVKAAPAKALGGVTGWFGNLRNFLNEVRNELKRVSWPSRKEVYATTVVVILTSIFFGLYLWGLDQVFERSVVTLFRYFGAQ
jgi:preprotein translocase subunit SecE